MIMKQIYFFILIAILSCFTAVGADSLYYFRCYYEKMNLPQTSILQMTQDKNGYIWLATGRGVYRFDGNEVVRLSDILPPGQTVPQESVPWVSVYTDGKLWMANGYIFDSRTGEICDNPLPVRQMVNAPMTDKQGGIWLSYPDRYVWQNIASSDSLVITQPVAPGITCSLQYTWGITTDGNLLRMQVGQKSVRTHSFQLKGTGIKQPSLLCAINDDEILIGTSRAGVWHYRPSDGKVRHLINERHVRAITANDSSAYWIATGNGIYVYHADTGRLQHLPKDAHNPLAIQDHSIFSFYVDREGGMWCGSYFRGLSYMPAARCHFEPFRPGKQYPGLEGTVVRAFCRDGQGNLWIATDDAGLNCSSATTGIFANYAAYSGFPLEGVQALCADENILWCGGVDGGICQFDIDRRRVTATFRTDDGHSALLSDTIHSILKDTNGDIWIGTPKGIQVFNKSARIFRQRYPEVTSCRQLLQDRKGRIWAVSMRGLTCILPDGQICNYNWQGGSVQSVMENRDGEIWIATSEGIARFDEENNRLFDFRVVGQTETTNFVYRIEEDELGYFWISTAHGLLRYDPRRQTPHLFTTLEGLPENRFSPGASFRDTDGGFYFGTINGYTRFYPSQLRPVRVTPHPALTKVTCAGSDTARILYHPSTKGITIRHWENNFTFEFSSFTYTAPEALRYRYRLDPFDRGWHERQGCAPVSYPRLPYGNYTLRLQTTDYNGVWADNEISYPIEVIPPFYLSWWARCIYLLMVLSAVILLLRAWMNRIHRKQQQHLMEVRDATEREIYQTKIDFFTTIVHEIRTPLTLIKAPLDQEMETNPSDNLQLVEKNVERLQHLCTQLLDFRRMESEHLQLNFVRTDVPQLLESICYRFSAQMRENGRQFEHNLSEIQLEAPVDREAFTKIVSNLLSNAIKYSDKKIMLELSSSGKEFSLSVSNDGTRIDTSDRGRVFNLFYRTEDALKKEGTGIGLSFCRSLAEMHNGRLELAEDECYTRFVLTLPLEQQVVFSIDAVFDETDIRQENAAVLPDENAETILVAEDEPQLRAFLQRTLSATYRVLVAADGQQALQLIEQHAVSMVITDVMMPRMDGCELCRELKNRIELCGIPVIMLTAKTTVEARLDGYMAGAEEYIDKPFSMKYLEARIAAILTKRKQEAEEHRTAPLTLPVEGIADNSDRALVDKFCQLVQENITNADLNIAFVCEHLGVSQTTFFRKMRSLMEVSPNDYIRITRLEYAAAILRQMESVRISDVAYQLGFSSPSYFTRCFAQHYGMSPKEYAAQHKEEN